MLNVAPKSAQAPVKPRNYVREIQLREQARSITIRGRRQRDLLSFNMVVLALVVFFLVKVALVNVYGVNGYEARVDMFMSGTMVEQFSGRMLDIDPITAAVSKLLGVY